MTKKLTKILRQTVGPETNMETNEYERRTDDDPNRLYNSNNEEREDWTGRTCVWRAEGRMLNKTTSWTPDKKTHRLGRPRQRDGGVYISTCV